MIGVASFEVFEPDAALTDDKNNKSALWRQHAGAVIACLPAFIVGNTFGWSSFASPQFLKGATGFIITKSEASLMESLLTFAAAISCFPAGWITDKMGRKSTLLATAPLSFFGWCLLIWSNSIEMLYAGRFLLGISVGMSCVTAPVYSTEICQKEIRGAVGSYFQMLLAGGVLFAYVIGSELDVFWLSLICGMLPIIFGFAFFYFPDTPVYYVLKGQTAKARDSLQYFRGNQYDVESELLEITDYSDRKRDLLKENIWKEFGSKQGIKSLLMSIGLMIFQQMSGINAFIFNATDILESAGSSLDAKYETIIIGLMQLIGAFIVALLVDEVGRVMMLGTSAIFMALCTFSLGIYFYFREKNVEVNDFTWLPLFSLSVFVVMFSVGFGAVPWMMMPELMPAAIKGPGISIACITNWISAFVVTRFFSDLMDSCGLGITFWLFCFVSICAAFFSFKILPETKGKSFEQIQEDLG